jgi:sulfate permease, SulP family
MPFAWIGRYRRSWLRGDLLAGLTLWAVLVPESLAYATLAGVSPVVGLYAAPGALILYAAFGSSRHLVTAPTSATAAFSAAAVAEVATHGSADFIALTTVLTLVAGLLAVLAGFLRLGFIANFISMPVLKGFIVGLALTIIVGQLPELFGIHGHSGDFFQKAWALITNLGDAHAATLAVGLGSLALVLGLRRISEAIPAALVVVVLAVLAAKMFGLAGHGVSIVGEIQSGLPTLGIPDVAAAKFLSLAPAAAGIVLLSFAEAIAAAKAYAAIDHYEIDADRELIGAGAANLASGLSSGMVVGGSLSKTAVNGTAGARSQLSGLVVAGLTIITLLFLTGLFEELPSATLGAIVIAAVIGLVDVPSLRRLYRVYSRRLGGIYGAAARPDFIAAVAAMLGVMVFDLLPGLFIGIAVSFGLLLYRSSHPNIARLGREPAGGRWVDRDRNPEVQEPRGVVVLRAEGEIFFANAEEISSAARRAASQEGIRGVVIDAEAVSGIDVTGVEMLSALASDLDRDHVALALAGAVGQVRDVLGKTEIDDDLGHQFPTVQAAVDRLSR